jgi:apolipoprotein N-acyltransferase
MIRLQRDGLARHPLALLIGGALGALAMPPFDGPFLLIPMMVQAVWVLDCIRARVQGWRAQIRQAFVCGWLLGFGYFTAGLWWLAYAFLVEPDQFALLIPLGIFGLPAVLALFFAAGLMACLPLWSAHVWRVLTLAGMIGLAEGGRTFLFTGLPWNSFGLALAAIPSWAQAASVIGQPGLTVLAVLIAATPAPLFAKNTKAHSQWILVSFSLALLLGLTWAGQWRLAQAKTDFVDPVRLRVIQPNIPQDEKFTPAHRDEIMRAYLSLSAGGLGPDKTGMRGVTHVIWPESAFPFLIARDAAALGQIAALLAPDAVLVTGAVRDERASSPLVPKRYFNSALTINAKGQIIGSTDKVHLVPFGEYLPFADMLGRLGLRQFVPSPGIFTAADSYAFLPVPGLDKVQALICYESIFPAAVTSAQHRPSLFINLTNDAWFGLSPGPHQHFAQARLRAIEEGVPLVRSANGGISAVVDPYGRIVAGLRLGESGAFTAPLPKAISPTVFALLGWILPFSLILLCLLPAIRARWAGADTDRKG